MSQLSLQSLRRCCCNAAENSPEFCLFWVFSLPGIEYVITQLKSLILSMGLIDRHITVEKAVLLSRLEEEYQVNWCRTTL